MRKLFRATQARIDKGVQANCLKCPIAITINETLPNAEAHVTASTVSFYTSQFRKYIQVNKRLAHKIMLYDSTGVMEPFNFYLDI